MQLVGGELIHRGPRGDPKGDTLDPVLGKARWLAAGHWHEKGFAVLAALGLDELENGALRGISWRHEGMALAFRDEIACELRVKRHVPSFETLWHQIGPGLDAMAAGTAAVHHVEDVVPACGARSAPAWVS